MFKPFEQKPIPLFDGIMDWKTACKESLKNINDLDSDHGYFAYQNKVNHDVNAVESHAIIDKHIQQKGQDYRDESKPNPVPGLSDRKKDNTEIARTKSCG